MLLLRSYSHGSTIFLYYFIKKGMHFFRKTSYDINGIQNIKNEFNGYQWYFKQNQKILNHLNTFVRDSFMLIDIPKFNGNKGCYRNGFDALNKKIIIESTKHYINTWPFNSNPYNLHGDLSIDNIIYNSNENSITFIDWEHYTQSKSIPWGFDILHLLFETLYFNWKKRN